MQKLIFKIIPPHLFSFLIFFCFVYTAHAENLSTSAKKPNIIIVITDDQGYGDLGHHGNTVIKTPSLDAFSKESLNLTNYHVGTTCAPTRAGLMTGRNCNRNGVWHTIVGASILNKEEVTIADVLQDRGYETGMFGKWHLGDNHPFHPHERGFKTAFYHGGGGVGQTPDYWNNDYFDDTYWLNGKPVKKKGYCTDVWFDAAIDFIASNKKKPFFCYLSLNAPHAPNNLPKEYYDMYKDESSISEIQKRFYGMITNIDDNFDKLLRKLDDLGIADNTIVVFTTDNGTSKGYERAKNNNPARGYNAGMRGIKGSEYEGGHRVPFIMRWPKAGLNEGKSLGQLVAHVDILPTFMGLIGEEYRSAKTMDGIDVSAYLLHRKDKLPHRYLVTDTQRVRFLRKGKNSCVMDDDWRLINGKELYYIPKDPGQKNNVSSKNPEKVKEMNDFYEKWWSDVIKESKHSVIELGSTDDGDVLTCHDASISRGLPAWNQEVVRKGKKMIPGPFLVNFVEAGTYRFFLRRWPKESGLAIGAPSNDGRPATLYTLAVGNGVALQFRKAYIDIGGTVKSVEVDNTKTAAVIEMKVPKGTTELKAYFDKESDTDLWNAFYIDVEKVN